MLFHVKGKRTPVLKQVKPSGESLNQGDAFILVAQNTLYLWIGTGANIMEKNKAVQCLDHFKSVFPKHAVERLDGGATTPAFWEALGGECPIKDAASGGADAEHEAANILRIYEINGEEFTLIAEKAAAKKDLLKAGKSYLIHRGDSIVVYNGAGVSPEVAKNSIGTALKFINKNGLPLYTSIATAREGKPSGALTLIFA
ncbi:hypothetical protein TRFO_27371 [Tritrichomonas foetus]|uniref:Gelsolin-like domain-containing protein n=1 Tax=Tritrichomonas foetus TaxID=1144522 RepID=A0A1J4K5N6_9EUKA|nr:hypothetical protein TRFO_27371 [Tritrichomonas foetus]|eukprot:OHT04990.1 hypothetical protein TRFO_27371 [Tritrichomonas foetus]